MKNLGSGPCWGLKKGVAPTDTHMGLGPQNPTKKLTHLVHLLGHLLSQNYVSNFFVNAIH